MFDIDKFVGGVTLLRAAKQLRAQAWGLGVGGDQPASDVRFDLVRADGALRGFGVTDSIGRYKTGSLWGEGSKDHRVTGPGLATPVFVARSRTRHRRVLREISSAGGTSIDWHLSGMSVRAWIGSDGKVRVESKSNGLGASYRLESVIGTASSVCVRWDNGRRLRIWLLSEEAGSVVERWSDDLGESWTMSEVLATGDVKYPTLAVHPDGRRFAYWINGSAVDGVIRDRSGNELGRVSGVRSGVDSVGLAAGLAEKPGGLVQVELVCVESGSVVSSLSTDGENFV